MMAFMKRKFDDEALAQLAKDVGHALSARHWRLAAAESCTGGWITKLITDVPDSSSWLDRGFVTYCNAAKTEMLGVAEATLAAHGAVSEETARAMVAGALAHSTADVACAVTGIAGPGGAVEGKPVGTVWFAWAARGGEVEARRVQLDGDREAVRRQSVALALQGVLDRARHPAPADGSGPNLHEEE